MACRFYYFGGGNHKCSKSGQYGRILTNSEYSSYCKNGWNRCDIYKDRYHTTNRNTNNPNNQNTGSGCFVTTIVCQILGKNDNDIILQKLRWFRDNILQNNEGKYDDILKNYDTIGPIISNKIVNDKNREQKAQNIYKVLTKIYRTIEETNYDKACELYYLLIQSLIEEYNLTALYNSILEINYGYEKGEYKREQAGHGKRKIRTQKSNL
ncbi:MAG: hypothetical protein VZS44_08895 [Bacilli bacterium]|nr:hypothetical protein [Bacilli bacterium]